MLRVIGAGLGRTGTHSLSAALEILGLRTIHFDRLRLNDVLDASNPNPDFRRYDDVDAVVDVPASLFYRELSAAYPAAKVILTTRQVDAWWRSIKKHFDSHRITNERRLMHRVAQKLGVPRTVFGERSFDTFRRNLRHFAYGSTEPTEFLYKKRFIEHNELVLATIPPERLLVMDIPAGEGWEKLCPFLGVDIPSAPFPHEQTPVYAANDSGAENPPTLATSSHST